MENHVKACGPKYIPIDELNFSMRTYTILKKAYIYCVGDICACSPPVGSGTAVAREIVRVLQPLGIDLAKYPQWNKTIYEMNSHQEHQKLFNAIFHLEDAITTQSTIKGIEFTESTHLCLSKAGVNTVNDLFNISPEELPDIRPENIYDIDEVFKEGGIHLPSVWANKVSELMAVEKESKSLSVYTDNMVWYAGGVVSTFMKILNKSNISEVHFFSFVNRMHSALLAAAVDFLSRNESLVDSQTKIYALQSLIGVLGSETKESSEIISNAYKAKGHLYKSYLEMYHASYFGSHHNIWSILYNFTRLCSEEIREVINNYSAFLTNLSKIAKVSPSFAWHQIELIKKKFYLIDSIHPLDFIINNGVLEKYVGMDRDVVVPYLVTTISAKAFDYFPDIESLSLPHTVVKIESGAFSKCNHLTRLYIHETLKDYDLPPAPNKHFRVYSREEVYCIDQFNSSLAKLMSNLSLVTGTDSIDLTLDRLLEMEDVLEAFSDYWFLDNLTHRWGSKLLPDFYKIANVMNLTTLKSMVQLRIGNLYFYSHLPKSRAFNYYQMSSRNWNRDADFKLGLCYIQGHGVDNDYQKGLELIKRSAEDGSLEAQAYIEEWQL